MVKEEEDRRRPRRRWRRGAERSFWSTKSAGKRRWRRSLRLEVDLALFRQIDFNNNNITFAHIQSFLHTHRDAILSNPFNEKYNFSHDAHILNARARDAFSRRERHVNEDGAALVENAIRRSVRGRVLPRVRRLVARAQSSKTRATDNSRLSVSAVRGSAKEEDETETERKEKMDERVERR